MAEAKLVVTKVRGGSQVSLVSARGKVLLRSGTFSEPRAKGATVRALKGLLGDVTVQDDTRKRAAAKPADGNRRPSSRRVEVTHAPAVAGNGTAAPTRRTRKARAAA